MMSTKKPYPLAAQVGKRISQFREAREWNQTELGKRSGGISQKRISDVERGVRTPRLDTVDRIARALSVEPFELFLPQGRKANGAIAIDGRKIASVLKRCDARSRECLWAVMETIAEYRTRQVEPRNASG